MLRNLASNDKLVCIAKLVFDIIMSLLEGWIEEPLYEWPGDSPNLFDLSG